MRVAIGCDHAGFDLKQSIKAFLATQGVVIDDVGTGSKESVDYPDYAERVAGAVRNGGADRGILICYTGAGMCIAANKMLGIRAAQAWDLEIARLTRQHNDANILCLPGGFLDSENAQKIVKVWLETSFEGGRHQRRVDKISRLDQHK